MGAGKRTRWKGSLCGGNSKSTEGGDTVAPWLEDMAGQAWNYQAKKEGCGPREMGTDRRLSRREVG